jgi:hypothetical protein
VSLQAPAGQKTAAPDSAAEAGWTHLFNGRDFTGWRVSKPESFKVENGAIAANGRASHVYYDGPFLGHTFRNFELKVDVMVKANANGGSNGGVYILTEFEERGGKMKRADERRMPCARSGGSAETRKSRWSRVATADIRYPNRVVAWTSSASPASTVVGVSGNAPRSARSANSDSVCPSPRMMTCA